MVTQIVIVARKYIHSLSEPALFGVMGAAWGRKINQFNFYFIFYIYLLYTVKKIF